MVNGLPTSSPTGVNHCKVAENTFCQSFSTLLPWPVTNPKPLLWFAQEKSEASFCLYPYFF